jgi:hypothetical protein
MESSDKIFILFSDRRLREHHRRQSVTVDDTDLMLHRQANRRSILYGGSSQGPKFWSQLSAAWNGSDANIDSPSPTSVRDVQAEWSAQQEESILKTSHGLASPSTTSIILDDDPRPIKVGYSIDDGSSHRTLVASCSTRTSSIVDHNQCDYSHPFLSVWDRLDALSIRERRNVHAYHQTMSEQNEKVHGKKDGKQESIPAVLPQLRGRLRRQHSWNGRDSQRNLHVARGSIMAEVDDCSLRHLLSVLDGEMMPCGNVEELHNDKPVDEKERAPASYKPQEYVMNLVL